jgi:hypothetical protein
MVVQMRAFRAVCATAFLLVACGDDPDSPTAPENAGAGGAVVTGPVTGVGSPMNPGVQPTPGSTVNAPVGGAAGAAMMPGSTAGMGVPMTMAGNGSTAGGGMTTSGAGGGSAMAGGAGMMGNAGSTPEPVAAPTEKFSFFVTSLAVLQDLSDNADGFGGNLSYGETGPGAGLRGADKLCAIIADRSMPNASAKGWRAFLSVSKGEDGNQVDAIDRIGEGPWYDRRGRLFAMNKADLLHFRPTGDAAVINNFPNEDGIPNKDPDGTGEVDNHDTLTGSNAQGKLYNASATCLDWTSDKGDTASGKPRVGHSWPRIREGGTGGRPGGMTQGGDGDGYGHWISSLTEAGCAPGARLEEMGGPRPEDPSVGSGGGYGGFYCFALKP